MLQRIVILRSQESLRQGSQEKSIAPADSMLEHEVQVKGLLFDRDFPPVSIPGYFAMKTAPVRALGFQYADLFTSEVGVTYGIRVQAEDEDVIGRLRQDRAQAVVGVYADPSISVFPSVYCGRAAIGNAAEVAKMLGVKTLQQAKITGKKVRIAVVDTGINGEKVPVSGGWSQDPNYHPGTAPTDHGTMVAYDALIAAPDARIFDYALLRSEANTWTAFLSDGIAALADLMDLMQKEPGPLVVNNSWGMFNRAEDAPIGTPENYSANIDHPFNQIVRALVGAGADVFFAAGNCGGNCPDLRCGDNDRGQGVSIHGANSHPDVITVAAVTVTHRRLGYSSQGPGGLDPQKPDLAGYSHFSGSGVYPADGGTSAASPVAAGVAAALRQKFSEKRLLPKQLKGVLQRTSIDLEGDGWDCDLGFGVINAAAAWKHLTQSSGRKRIKKATKASPVK